MNKKANSQDIEYEIWKDETPILRGKYLDELLRCARLMYPDATFIIKNVARKIIKE